MNVNPYAVCSMVLAQKTRERVPDKSSFEAWWLMDVADDDYDAALQKKRVKARLDHVLERANSMKSQMDRIEELVQKLR